MKKNVSLQKKLQEILSQKSFEELEYYKQNKSWKSWAADDRNLLAALFVMQGEKQLEQHDKNAQESFDLATKVAPENSDIFFQIASAFLRNRDSDPAVNSQIALDAIKQCLALKSHCFEALNIQGVIYNCLGLIREETDLFQEAQESFSEAEIHSGGQANEVMAQFYSNWGISSAWCGKISGEAVDFYAAVEKFRMAAERGLQDKSFWLHYGDAISDLGLLIGREEYIQEAIEFYRNAVRLAFDFFDGWLHLGCAFQHLFELYKTEELYRQASECFRMASEIVQDESLLWTKWAQLTSMAGKIWYDMDMLQLSLEQFEQAHTLAPDVPQILSLWGETLTIIGSHHENIEVLRDAQKKIAKSLELNRDLPETWYSYGTCLAEIGHYFHEEEYYAQAIQKFQMGLTLHQNEPLLWYGLALAYFAVGELNGDVSWVETASKLFSRVVEFGGQDMRRFWNDWGVALMTLAEMRGDRSALETAIEKFEYILPDFVEKLEDESDFEEEINPDWVYNFGCAYDFLGDFTNGIENYEKAIRLLTHSLVMDPNHAHARYNLALAWAHLGTAGMDVEAFHKSIEQFQLVLSRNNEDEMAWNDYGVTLIHLALLIQDPSKMDQSQKIYEVAEIKLMQAIALGCTQAYYNIACLYSLTENYAGAVNYLEKAAISDLLPPVEELLHDAWLEKLRQTPVFREFLEDFNRNSLY